MASGYESIIPNDASLDENLNELNEFWGHSNRLHDAEKSAVSRPVFDRQYMWHTPIPVVFFFGLID